MHPFAVTRRTGLPKTNAKRNHGKPTSCRLGRVSQDLEPDCDRPQDDSSAVGDGEFVVACRDCTPLFESLEAPLGSITLQRLYASTSNEGGLPPFVPRRFRFAMWSGFSGITASMPRSRSSFRFAFDAYALSAIARTGFVRGRPLPRRGTLKLPITSGNIGESPA